MVPFGVQKIAYAVVVIITGPPPYDRLPAVGPWSVMEQAPPTASSLGGGASAWIGVLLLSASAAPVTAATSPTASIARSGPLEQSENGFLLMTPSLVCTFRFQETTRSSMPGFFAVLFAGRSPRRMKNRNSGWPHQPHFQPKVKKERATGACRDASTAWRPCWPPSRIR